MFLVYRNDMTLEVTVDYILLTRGDLQYKSIVPLVVYKRDTVRL